MIHQWMEGNLPVSSKCAVCDKTCGSVLRFVLLSYQNIVKYIKIIGLQFKLGSKIGGVYGAKLQYTLHAALSIPSSVHWDPIDLVLYHQQLYILLVRLRL